MQTVLLGLRQINFANIVSLSRLLHLMKYLCRRKRPIARNRHRRSVRAAPPRDIPGRTNARKAALLTSYRCSLEIKVGKGSEVTTVAVFELVVIDKYRNIKG